MQSYLLLLTSTLMLTLLVPATALAVPVIDSASDNIDDATITLRVMNQTISGDVKDFCEVRIQDDGGDVDFSSGDKVFLWVYEDDTPGNDLIWQTQFTVTASEVSSNSLDRTIDCSAEFGTDGFGSNLEIFADSRVEKAQCTGFCRWDRPTTNNIDVAEVEDDGAEEDDVSGDATVAGLGTTTDRINRDQDWFEFTLTVPSNVTADALHMPSVGRIDMAILDNNNSPVAGAMITDETDKTRVYAPSLPAGTYFIRLSPRVSNDFAFYDFAFTIDNLMVSCTPGNVENRDCGNCGTEERTCDNLGMWGTWGSCTNEGACSVGAVETQSCENGGTETRMCDNTCTWGPYGACEVPPCDDGTMEACFTGNTENRGVGACTDGMRTCTGGSFGECTGEVLPEMEICDDTLDNDCDGAADAADDDCTMVSGELGAPCTADGDCSEMWTCIQPPAHERFRGGYCGEARDCNGISFECGAESVCGAVGDEEYCLAGCTSDADCRQDYVCKPYNEGGGCVPRCLNDGDCASGDTCNTTSGLCEQGMTTMDPGPEDTSSDAGSDTSTPDASTDMAMEEDPGDKLKADAGCGCRVARSSDSPPVGWLALLALGAVFLLRRRRK